MEKMKLKTLKDIYGNDFDNSLLRQEAIKWVKEFYTKEDKDPIKFIIHFFNLTEEELK